MGVLTKGKGGLREPADERSKQSDGFSPLRERDVLEDDGIRNAGRDEPDVAQTVLASARHELRSPLQSIQGFAELLGSDTFGTLNDRQSSFVEHILQASQELTTTLDVCVELAELALGKRAVERAHRGLRGALADALELATQRAGRELHTRWASGCTGAFVCVEPAALARALHALLHGLAPAPATPLQLDVTVEGAQAKLTFRESSRNTAATLLTLDEYVLRRRATRSLLWLRLASELFVLQEGSLSVSEPLDCAEVRLPLSSPH